MQLGVGSHFGEWWGEGIQINYGIKGRKFSLFNVRKWLDNELKPTCCDVVPLLYKGDFDTNMINTILENLDKEGSKASPGFMRPEGIVIYHAQSNTLFKKTLKNDSKGKSYGS